MPDDASLAKTPALEFLQKDYELKARVLAEHYGRMWTRFNFFMVASTAIAISLFQGLRDGKTLHTSIAFPVAGAVLALCWYVFGAQDRYLVEAYRSEIKRTGSLVSKALGLNEVIGKLGDSSTKYSLVGDISAADVSPRLYQWRVNSISTTKLVALFPLLVLSIWLTLIVVGLFNHA